jgi:hypothetical protein
MRPDTNKCEVEKKGKNHFNLIRESFMYDARHFTVIYFIIIIK